MITEKTVGEILSLLEDIYPLAECSLDNDGDPFHLFVRAILSAQCTDKRVNALTKTLFQKYPGICDFAKADIMILAEDIRSCGLFRAKSNYLIRSSQILLSEYDGNIPSTIEKLVTFPGVGRKIANLLLGELYGVPAIVVDIHCARVSGRLGLTDSHSPAAIEKDLMACIPEDKWITLGHRLVAHGRAACHARNPACFSCALREVCLHASRSEHGFSSSTEDG